MPDLSQLEPILKAIGYTGPATLGVMAAAGLKFLFTQKKKNPEKELRDELRARVTQLEGQLERAKFQRDGWYWLTKEARRVAEMLVLIHGLPPLSPWGPDPDPNPPGTPPPPP